MTLVDVGLNLTALEVFVAMRCDGRMLARTANLIWVILNVYLHSCICLATVPAVVERGEVQASTNRIDRKVSEKHKAQSHELGFVFESIGGQSRNRTTDTRIFNPSTQALMRIDNH